MGRKGSSSKAATKAAASGKRPRPSASGGWAGGLGAVLVAAVSIGVLTAMQSGAGTPGGVAEVVRRQFSSRLAGAARDAGVAEKPPQPQPGAGGGALGPRQVVFRSEASLRADLHYDDGRFGQVVATLDAGASTAITTQEGHGFFWTVHGRREQLVASTGEPIEAHITADTTEVVLPAGARAPEGRCLDRYRFCAAEARDGGCPRNPGWMIVNCCASCDGPIGASRLIDPRERCSRDFLNTTASRTWAPGDLDGMFERILSDPEVAAYAPAVLSRPPEGPWIVTLDAFLDDEEAEGLIRGGEMAGFQRSTDQGRVNSLGEMEKVQSSSRTSSNAWCNRECERLPVVQRVTAKIEGLTGVARGNYESFQILRYEEGQFYGRHHDAGRRDHLQPAGPRILTVFLYLSDVEGGGHTRFSDLDISVPPRKGRALIWPSVLDADPEGVDYRTYHEAMPVTEGVKYAANHWIHLHDFAVPNRWGCTGSFG